MTKNNGVIAQVLLMMIDMRKALITDDHRDFSVFPARCIANF